MIFTPTESLILAAMGFIAGGCIYTWRKSKEPQIRPSRENVIDRCAEILARSAWHREQLDAESEEMRTIHGYEKYSYEADELEGVVWDGADYEATMERIMKRFKEEA